MVINDALVQEIQVFKEQTNVFDEYMYQTYLYKPMSYAHMAEIMLETLMALQFSANDLKKDEDYDEREEIDRKYLNVVFKDFFNMIHADLSKYTVSIREYAYMCQFLYPHYMEKVYNLNSEIRGVHS